MKNQKTQGKSRTQFGLFLFFLGGLFLLQIAFAFTIHGDIGPHTNLIPGIERPASPVLVGRIDSLVSETRLKTPVRVAPEGAFAPASRDFDTAGPVARIDTGNARPAAEKSVRKIEGDRFAEYTIQAGDTLDRISRKLYGNQQMVQSIVRLNRINDERNLRLGATLKLPRAGLLDSVRVN
ncbi:MAG: LysM peptidoglycan-binding domain-containing protein [Candidatus Riflebacteria bacterium]|jgi:nucleoid-associated protein YgaU|nr:LysM peptidoglycan-binding domain-containing protein [Candidatus Riflebacteria bacterium]